MDKSSLPDKILFEGESTFNYIPACEHIAGNDKFIEKALALQHKLNGSFDITCDLEDGAPIGNELSFLSDLINIIKSPKNRYGMIGIRIHGPGHPLHRRELEEIVKHIGDRIRYITIPKVTSIAEIIKAQNLIVDIQKKISQSIVIPLHILIETHGALRDVWQIAALPFVETLDFGILDFISSHLGAIPMSNAESPGQFEHHLITRAKAEIVSACLAYGKTPSHNITIDYKNQGTLINDIKRARYDFGFLRMWSIHPSQIEPIIDGLSPTFKELEEASKIIAQGIEAKWGPITYKDKLYDRASYRYYWAIIRRADTNKIELSSEIKHFLRANS